MAEGTAKKIEKVGVEVVALLEVEVVMQIDGAYFRAMIVADMVASVTTAGIQVVVLKFKIQILTMKLVETLLMTSLEYTMNKYDVHPE